MSSSEAIAYTVVAPDPSSDGVELSTQDLRNNLQRGSDEVKLETLRRIIVSTLNGSPQPTLLMPIIQYVLPSRNKQLKKMLHFYWQVCPKLDDKGNLKQEMILVWYVLASALQRAAPSYPHIMHPPY